MINGRLSYTQISTTLTDTTGERRKQLLAGPGIKQ
jgi:hypothetical protein